MIWFYKYGTIRGDFVSLNTRNYHHFSFVIPFFPLTSYFLKAFIDPFRHFLLSHHMKSTGPTAAMFLCCLSLCSNSARNVYDTGKGIKIQMEKEVLHHFLNYFFHDAVQQESIH